MPWAKRGVKPEWASSNSYSAALLALSISATKRNNSANDSAGLLKSKAVVAARYRLLCPVALSTIISLEPQSSPPAHPSEPCDYGTEAGGLQSRPWSGGRGLLRPTHAEQACGAPRFGAGATSASPPYPPARSSGANPAKSVRGERPRQVYRDGRPSPPGRVNSQDAVGGMG